MENEISEDKKPTYLKLNKEYEDIKVGNVILKINNLNIIKEEQNYWINLSNKLFGNNINIENLIFEIELKYPISVFFQFYSDIKNHVKKKLDELGESNTKEARNALIKRYWSKLKDKAKDFYYNKVKEYKIKYDLERLLVKKFVMLYYDPRRRNVCEPKEMFADTMILFIKLNKVVNEKYCKEYISLEKLKNYFFKIYNEIDEDEDEILFNIKQRCINNYNYLSKIFDDENPIKIEFIEDIKSINFIRLGKNFIFNPVDLFKEDLINGNMENNIISSYKKFYKKLDDNIKNLYKIKAKKLTLLNKYKQKLSYY